MTCPGCGATGVNPNRLACEQCWFRLPLALRRRWALLRRTRHPLSATAREQVIADVSAWYASNGAPECAS